MKEEAKNALIHDEASYLNISTKEEEQLGVPLSPEKKRVEMIMESPDE